jgi:site-specific recombinase XerD
MRGEGVRRDYRRIVKSFLEFCGKEVEEVRFEDVRAWKERLEAEDYAASTMRTYLETVRSFFDHASTQGLVESNPVATELLPKVKAYASGRYLTEEEEAKLLDAIDVESEWGKRDYALILLLVRSGRRVG